MNTILKAVEAAVQSTPIRLRADDVPAGLPEAAAELIGRATAEARHKSREQRILALTENIADAVVGDSREDHTSVASLLRRMALQGTGGPMDLGRWPDCTQATDRRSLRVWPVSEHCGTGRQGAQDGAAWDRAIRSSMHDDPEITPLRLCRAMGRLLEMVEQLPEELGDWGEDLLAHARGIARTEVLVAHQRVLDHRRNELEADCLVSTMQSWAVVLQALEDNPTSSNMWALTPDLAPGGAYGPPADPAPAPALLASIAAEE